MNRLINLTTSVSKLTEFLKKRNTSTSAIIGTKHTKPLSSYIGIAYNMEFGIAPKGVYDLQSLCYALHGMRGLRLFRTLESVGIDLTEELAWVLMSGGKSDNYTTYGMVA